MGCRDGKNPAALAGGRLELSGPDDVIGRLLRECKPVVLDGPACFTGWRGLPGGCPAIESFIGIPLFKEAEMIGMVGLANRPGVLAH